MKLFPILFCCLISLPLLTAQEGELSPIIFIYDASGSMWGQIEGKTKMEIASEVLSDAVRSMPGEQGLGLVAYGHRQKGDCEDVEFVVEVGENTGEQVIDALSKIRPLGKTPLAYSALEVIDWLRQKGRKATIILVTDGIESCQGDLCEVIRKAKEEGIEFRLHIIGFGLKSEETEQLRCAAGAGEGNYYDAADAGGLADVLDEATEMTVDEPAGNVSVFAIRNGEPIDALIKAFRKGSEEGVISARTYRDTALFHLDPGSWELEVQPLENSDVGAIRLYDVVAGDEGITHRTAAFDAGKLEVTATNNGEGLDAVVKVYRSGDGTIAASGRTYGRTKEYELNPGTYDVAVEGLGIKGLATKARKEGIRVDPGETTEVRHNFSTGVAMIGARIGNTLIDAVITIKDREGKTSIVGGRTYTSANSNPKKFVINPGTYQVTLSALGEHAGKKESFTLEVVKGKTVEKVVLF